MTQHRDPKEPGKTTNVPRLPAEDVTNVPATELEERVGGDERAHHDTAHDRSKRDREPQPDHSEREGGDDQDIDTAGMVPGNKATKNTEPTGF